MSLTRKEISSKNVIIFSVSYISLSSKGKIKEASFYVKNGNINLKSWIIIIFEKKFIFYFLIFKYFKI